MFNLYSNLTSTIDLPIGTLTTFIINKYLGFELISVYKIFEKIGSMLGRLAEPLNQIIYPELNNLISNNNKQAANSLVKKLILGIGTVGVIGMSFVLFTYKLWLWLFIPNYEVYIGSLMLYILFIIFVNVTASVHSLFLASGYIKYTLPIVLIINIIGTYLEIKLKLSIFSYGENMLIWSIFQVCVLIYYTMLLALLAIRCMRKREFIYTIFITTISIFTVRRVFYFYIFKDYSNKIIEYNKVLTFIAYLILLIGLYIEIVRRIEESIRLNSQVNDFQKLKIKYKEIKAVEKAKGQFFANLSHEIKTPINIIYSCVQLLDINKKEGEKALWDSYNKYDNTIKQNCYRLLRLVNNLVDMTKIDSGYMNLTFVNYEIVSLVEDIILSIVPYVESKNINVLFDTYIEELEIKCDPESIERVILNLLSNAVKFTNDNGNIFVLMDADDDYVTIRVKDDGVGVSPELQEEIFKRFVQEDKSLNRKKEGSGIGLALVKSLVELHNGQVYLEKGTEEGSEFVVKLPNVRIESQKENDNKIIDVENKPLVQKIHIEFSDIYELY